MRRVARLAAWIACSGIAAWDAVRAAASEWPDPKRFEREIAAFERADRRAPPPSGAIVVAGSSSIRIWQRAKPSIREDLAPLTVIPRGFGGSTMYDLLYYADRIVLPYRPRAVVVYEGDNDTAAGIAPEKVFDTFRRLVHKLHKHNPKMRVYFLAIKPSPKRRSVWRKAQAANDRIRRWCARDDRLFFIDVATPLLDEAGEPKAALFQADRLHLNRRGYAIWKKVIREVLIKHELAREAAKQESSGRVE